MLRINHERRSKMSQIRVFTIFSFDWLLNFWSTHPIVYCIPFTTIKRTHPRAAKNVKYFIIHHIIVSTHWNQTQTSHDVVVPDAVHPSHGIFSVTTTLIAEASQLIKKREIIIKKDKNILLKSFICNYFIN